MTRSTHRVALVLVLALGVALAGCSGGGTPTAPPGDGASGDGGDGGAQSGSNDGGDGSDGSGDGSDGGGDESDSTPMGTPEGSAATASPTATATATSTPNATGPTTEQLPRLGDVLEPADSFRYRLDVDQIDGNPVDYVQEGRYHEGDVYAQVSTDQGTSNLYVVDGQGYLVAGDVCQSVPSGRTRDPGNTTQANSWANTSIRASETTTRDGQEVYVYETESGPPNFQGPTTIYVSVESGHVVRQEAPHFVSETWDFGNADPVEAPC
jgi:hypothetical protein